MSKNNRDDPASWPVGPTFELPLVGPAYVYRREVRIAEAARAWRSAACICEDCYGEPGHLTACPVFQAEVALVLAIDGGP